MTTIIVGLAAAIAGMILLSRWMRRREREGDWDKEGHGTSQHPTPGVHLRGLEVPPQEPFG